MRRILLFMFLICMMGTMCSCSKTESTEQDTEIKHEVKFVIGEVAAEEIPSQYVEDGKYAVEPEEPEVDGYLFLGWCSDEELENCFEFQETPIEKDTTLYAYWYNETDKTDTDGDSLEDEYEKLLGLNPESNDTDGDGLSDYDELYYELDTDPCVFDTDNDGISDGDEDFDGDGLTNKEEFDMETAADFAEVDQEAARISEVAIDAFINKDITKLEHEFSEFAKDNTNLKDEIENAFEFIEGNITTIENYFIDDWGSSRDEQGGVWSGYHVNLYNLKTDKGRTYEIDIYGYFFYRNNEYKHGINHIYVHDKDIEIDSDLEKGMCRIGVEVEK